MMISKGTKVEYEGIVFDSKGEAVAYRQLIDIFGKENVEVHSRSFTVLEKEDPKIRVFRHYGDSLQERKTRGDSAELVFSPDFIIKHNGFTFILEFKAKYGQNPAYNLRKTMFFRSDVSSEFDAYFECKSKQDVSEAIYQIEKFKAK